MGHLNTFRAFFRWWTKPSRRDFLLIFILSFAIRTLFLVSWMIPTQYILPETVSEVGRVAKNLALTGQYADPYLLPTGPTAHPLPLYTGLIALLYRLFGLTLTAGYVRCFLGIAGYSAMYAMLPWFGERAGLGRRAGLLAGIVGSLIPQQGTAEVIGWVANEPLTAVALGLLLIVFLGRGKIKQNSFRTAFLSGLGFGLAFHLSPTLLPVMLGLLTFELFRSRDRKKGVSAVIMVIGMVLVCVPWSWRNYNTFQEFFFLRSNFGLELRLGNHDGAVADMDRMDVKEGDAMRHPGNNMSEALLVREMGEIAYMQQARHEAMEWITSHPGEFGRLTISRILYFWFGSWYEPILSAGISLLTILAFLGLRRAWTRLTILERAVLLIPLVTYPLTYYLVPYMSRYTVPVSWILLLLAAVEVNYWIKKIINKEALAYVIL